MHTVKVQLPLNGGTEPGMGLVYARGRFRACEQPIPAAALAALGGDVKGFFRAIWTGGGWQIGARVLDQDW